MWDETRRVNRRLHLNSPRSLTVCSALRSQSGCVSHQGILSSPVASVPWQSGLPFTRYNLTFKFKGRGQSYPSQCSIHLTHSLCVWHQGILSTPVLFVPWQWGLPFPRYNLTLTIQISHRLDQPFLRYGKNLRTEFLQNFVGWETWQRGVPIKICRD